MIEITLRTTVDEPVYHPGTGDVADLRTVSDHTDLMRFPTASALVGWLHDKQLISPSDAPDPTGATCLSDDPAPEDSTGRMTRRSVHPVTVEPELWEAILRILTPPTGETDDGPEGETDGDAKGEADGEVSA